MSLALRKRESMWLAGEARMGKVQILKVNSEADIQGTRAGKGGKTQGGSNYREIPSIWTSLPSICPNLVASQNTGLQASLSLNHTTRRAINPNARARNNPLPNKQAGSQENQPPPGDSSLHWYQSQPTVQLINLFIQTANRSQESMNGQHASPMQDTVTHTAWAIE